MSIIVFSWHFIINTASNSSSFFDRRRAVYIYPRCLLWTPWPDLVLRPKIQTAQDSPAPFLTGTVFANLFLIKIMTFLTLWLSYSDLWLVPALKNLHSHVTSTAVMGKTVILSKSATECLEIPVLARTSTCRWLTFVGVSRSKALFHTETSLCLEYASEIHYRMMQRYIHISIYAAYPQRWLVFVFTWRGTDIFWGR